MIMGAFEISNMPYIPAFHAWADHLESCAHCTEAHDQLRTGAEIPVTDFCPAGAKMFIDFMQAVAEQHVTALLN
jgi:preprotein translocase subunit SecA